MGVITVWILSGCEEMVGNNRCGKAHNKMLHNCGIAYCHNTSAVFGDTHVLFGVQELALPNVNSTSVVLLILAHLHPSSHMSLLSWQAIRVLSHLTYKSQQASQRSPRRRYCTSLKWRRLMARPTQSRRLGSTTLLKSQRWSTSPSCRRCFLMHLQVYGTDHRERLTY